MTLKIKKEIDGDSWLAVALAKSCRFLTILSQLKFITIVCGAVLKSKQLLRQNIENEVNTKNFAIKNTITIILEKTTNEVRITLPSLKNLTDMCRRKISTNTTTYETNMVILSKNLQKY